jgi:hypothetical protein
VNDDQTIPSCWDNVAVLGSSVNCKIDEISGSPGRDWAFNSEHFTRNHFGIYLFIFVLWNISLKEFLILRLTKLVLSVKIDPQLKA